MRTQLDQSACFQNSYPETWWIFHTAENRRDRRWEERHSVPITLKSCKSRESVFSSKRMVSLTCHPLIKSGVFVCFLFAFVLLFFLPLPMTLEETMIPSMFTHNYTKGYIKGVIWSYQLVLRFMCHLSGCADLCSF